jgi:Protein of unknown function (DUF3108)
MVPMSKLTLRIVLAVAVCTVAFAATVPAAAGQPEIEEFHYRWKLGSFLGKVAGLFLPSRGDGVLTFTPQDDTLTSELLITSEQSAEGEFWRYGAEIDRTNLHARRAWSSYAWRGKSGSKSAEIEAQGVIDVASSIYAIRRDPPTIARSMDVWSDGKIYPVLVIPRGEERRKIAGRTLDTRRFTVRGYDAPSGRKWKGQLELWLADDPAATPVEIHIERSLAELRLELTSLPESLGGDPQQ